MKFLNIKIRHISSTWFAAMWLKSTALKLGLYCGKVREHGKIKRQYNGGYRNTVSDIYVRGLCEVTDKYYQHMENAMSNAGDTRVQYIEVILRVTYFCVWLLCVHNFCVWFLGICFVNVCDFFDFNSFVPYHAFHCLELAGSLHVGWGFNIFIIKGQGSRIGGSSSGLISITRRQPVPGSLFSWEKRRNLPNCPWGIPDVRQRNASCTKESASHRRKDAPARGRSQLVARSISRRSDSIPPRLFQRRVEDSVAGG